MTAANKYRALGRWIEIPANKTNRQARVSTHLRKLADKLNLRLPVLPPLHYCVNAVRHWTFLSHVELLPAAQTNRIEWMKMLDSITCRRTMHCKFTSLLLLLIHCALSLSLFLFHCLLLLTYNFYTLVNSLYNFLVYQTHSGSILL